MTSQVSQVKEAIDIVALIGERIKLNRAGNNYKGLCPFHSEKSPSFFVNPLMQRYMCFGCHETGDAFTFLQKYDQMTFAESLQYLAKKAGIELTAFVPTKEDHHRERLLAALSLAKEFYHYLLVTHKEGEHGRAYLSDRGMHQETVTTFGIGVSLPQWDGLYKYLRFKKQFSDLELLDAGLIIRSSKGSYYDRFRGRLMFPLTDHRGRVVGFSGRLLDKEAKEAKYINSPETMLYHKSELLFGFSQLARFIREKEEVIVMEGEFDVLSSYQAHVQNVVAIKGSALTTKHMTLLARSARRIVLSLDSDNAGKEATKKAIAIARDFDVSLRVLPIQGGKDPDDIARQNPSQWREFAKQSVSVYDYLIDLAFGEFNGKTGEGKREITKELSPLIAGISNAVEQAHYMQGIAKRLSVSEDVFAREVRKATLPLVAPAREEQQERVERSRYDVLTAYVLSLFFHLSATDFQRFYERVAPLITDSIGTRLLEVALRHKDRFELSEFVRELPEELKQPFSKLYMEEDEKIMERSIDAELTHALEELEDLSLKEEQEVAAGRITELENKETLTPTEEEEHKRLLSTLRKSSYTE